MNINHINSISENIEQDRNRSRSSEVNAVGMRGVKVKYHFAGGLLKRGGLVNFPVSEGDGQVLDGGRF